MKRRRTQIPTILTLLALTALPTLADELPDGPGKAETQKLCIQCHDLAKAVSARQDRNGWGATMTKMVAMGMKGSRQDLAAVLDYLTKNYPPEGLPPLNINQARAIQLESRLSLKRSEAAAILKYRKDHGDFQSLDDLKQVPNIDFAKIEAKKDILVF
jgi:competence ComEA-like helix-hairpin-helix protein